MLVFEKDFSKEQLLEVATQFLEFMNSYHLFTFTGELGAGKTTLISAICEKLRVTDKVSSPTYSLINQYSGMVRQKDVQIYHIDLYRLRSEEELFQAGIEDILNSAEICFVEWPERLIDWTGRKRLDVYLSASTPEMRHIRIFSHEN